MSQRFSPVALLLGGSLTAVALLVTPAAGQTTWHVPADFPTVQGAIDAAVDGDAVLVAPGEYVGNLAILAKDVDVSSSDGPEVTVLRGTGVGSVVNLAVAPGMSARLAGFTVTGGVGSDTDFALSGGGLSIHSDVQLTPSSVVVEDLIVRKNGAPVAGGGLAIRNSQILLRDVLVEDNHSDGDGGGISMSGAASLVSERCLLLGNTAAGDGGGLWLSSGGGHWNDLVVDANEAAGNGGGVAFLSNGLALPMTRLVARGNVAGAHGGGLFIDADSGGFPAVHFISAARFLGNRARQAGGGAYIDTLGHSFSAFPASLGNGFRRSLFVGNVAGTTGGGVHVRVENNDNAGFLALAAIEFERSTFVGNVARASGGAAWVETAGSVSTQHQTATSSIFRGNLPDDFGGEGVDATFSQFDSPTAGLGNGDADPLFIDAPGGDFGLRGGSPCIDSAAAGLSLDDDGSPPDRGALPFRPWIEDGPGLAGTFGIPLITGVGMNSAGAPAELHLTGAPPHAVVALIMGFGRLDLPFAGGTLVPEVLYILLPVTDGAGELHMSGTWPVMPSDTKSWLQAWIDDAGGPEGFSASAALRATAR